MLDGCTGRESKVSRSCTKENVNADVLYRSPQALTRETDDGGVQVAVVDTDSIQSLLRKDSAQIDKLGEINFAQEQLKDQRICEMATSLKDGKLLHYETQAHKIAVQAPHYSLVSSMLLTPQRGIVSRRLFCSIFGCSYVSLMIAVTVYQVITHISQKISG